MRRKIPTLQALLCFDAAARHQSYTRAAQELALTQGAVSRQLTQLEGYLGVALFARTRHGMSLTERGRDYAAQVAMRLQALEQDTQDVMSQQGHGLALHLAAVPTFATRWLIPRLPALKALHPGLTVHIDIRTRAFMFTETAFDAALFAGTPEQVAQWAGTHAVKLLDEVVLPVCSPQLLGGRTCLTPQAMTELPLLQQTTRMEAWRQWFEAQGVSAPQALAGARFELFSMTAEAAAQGLGLALIPPLLISTELAQGRLVLACPQPLAHTRAYYLVRPAQANAPAAVQLFENWLLQACQQAR